jgi:hypothetical protein
VLLDLNRGAGGKSAKRDGASHLEAVRMYRLGQAGGIM